MQLCPMKDQASLILRSHVHYPLYTFHIALFQICLHFSPSFISSTPRATICMGYRCKVEVSQWRTL